MIKQRRSSSSSFLYWNYKEGYRKRHLNRFEVTDPDLLVLIFILQNCKKKRKKKKSPTKKKEKNQNEWGYIFVLSVLGCA